MGYQRWYDYDIRLSGVVRSMEFMNDRTQHYFAQKLLELSEQLLSERGGHEYIDNLHPKKKDGLEKSKAKKRWYDKSDTLHNAFNNLYALSAEDRQEIATRLTTPIMIVEGYEKHCRSQRADVDERVVEEILRTCMSEGQERAKRLYALYMHDFDMFAATVKTDDSPNRAKQKAPPGFWSDLLKNLQELLVPA